MFHLQVADAAGDVLGDEHLSEALHFALLQYGADCLLGCLCVRSLIHVRALDDTARQCETFAWRVTGKKDVK